MAYDASNNKEGTTNVVSSTPLSQDSPVTPINTPDSTATSSPTSSMPMSSQPSNQAAGGSKKASSGTFTNIQKYVAKNRPQAQRMSQAVTKNVGDQAAEIRQATESKRQDQQQRLSAAQGTLDSQMSEAKNIVQQTLQSPQQVVQNPLPSPDEIADQAQVQNNQVARFQELMNAPQVENIQDLNLAPQQAKVTALQNLAQTATNEQGRRNLMRQTFGKDRAYTRGQSMLDNIILGGDRQAQTNLIQGVQQQASDVDQFVDKTQMDSRSDVGMLGDRISNFGDNVRSLAVDAETGIQDNIDQMYDAALKERAALLDPTSDLYAGATGAAKQRLAELDAILGTTEGFTDYTRQFSGRDETGGHRPSHNLDLNKYLSQVDQFEQTGKVTLPNQWVRTGFDTGEYRDVVLEGDKAQEYINEGLSNLTHNRERQQIQGVYDQINRNLMTDQERDLYGLDQIQYGSSNENLSDFLGKYEQLRKSYEGLGGADDVVQRRLEQEGNLDFEALQRGEDISEYELADEVDVDRINALRNLIGRTDTITDEQIGDSGYLSSDDIESLLKGFSGE